MPKGLSAAAKREWSRVTDLLRERGVLDALDETALTDYVTCWERLRECEADISKRGVLVQGERGLVKNPACQLARTYRDALTKWCSEFGMTVNARSRLDLPKPERITVWSQFRQSVEAANEERARRSGTTGGVQP